jgi:parallel beta-helix repeat protein
MLAQKKNSTLVILFIEIFALGVLTGIVVGTGVVANLPYPPLNKQMPTYTFFTIKGCYYAESSSGVVNYHGTNASAVIQSALYSAKSGLFYFRKGDYYISNCIDVNHSNVVLMGEVEESDRSWQIPSIFGGGSNLIANGCSTILYVHGTNRSSALESIMLNRLCFDGNMRNYGNADYRKANYSLVSTEYVAELWIFQCGLRRSAGDAIHIQDGNEIMWIEENDISMNCGNGVCIESFGSEGVNYVFIKDNHMWDNGLDGIYYTGRFAPSGFSGSSIISNNILPQDNGNGITLDTVHNTIVEGNILSQDVGLGIDLVSCTNISLSNNTIYDCGNATVQQSS